MRAAGIMSGTSLDGIDVAVVDIGRTVKTVAFRSVRYSNKVREAILAVSDTTCPTAEISRLNVQLGELYAKAIGDWVRRYKVELIGCHGQTIYHEGRGKTPNTLQAGDGSLLAERTGVPVVSDFRTRDIAAGGKGAPLVPFADYRLFRHARRSRVALNIGGIANITVIPPCSKREDVIAFDTGPGNMVIDALVHRFTNGSQRMDRGGRIAARGRIVRPLLEELFSAPYYKAAPPKTAGREEYGSAFAERMVQSGGSFPDLVMTATVLTAVTIASAIRRFLPVDDLIVSGGGVHNPVILAYLAALLPGVNIQSSADYGINPDAKEAIAFAILAHETWCKRPSNLPSATGARRAVILGKVSY
jgi:anhydro-N-acetylmuramic acid kinase